MSFRPPDLESNRTEEKGASPVTSPYVSVHGDHILENPGISWNFIFVLENPGKKPKLGKYPENVLEFLIFLIFFLG